MDHSMATHPDEGPPPEATVGGASARAGTWIAAPAATTDTITSSTPQRTLRTIPQSPVVPPAPVGLRRGGQDLLLGSGRVGLDRAGWHDVAVAVTMPTLEGISIRWLSVLGCAIAAVQVIPAGEEACFVGGAGRGRPQRDPLR